jgi:hypothetical protein
MTTPSTPVVVIVDVANVMGSRPDGWWRDRRGAATRWLADLDGLVGRTVPLPDGSPVGVTSVFAVVEGQARGASAPPESAVQVVRAVRDGDTAIVEVTEQELARSRPVVVTADRGLRDRLPPGVVVAGPGWLRGLLG